MIAHYEDQISLKYDLYWNDILHWKHVNEYRATRGNQINSYQYHVKSPLIVSKNNFLPSNQLFKTLTISFEFNLTLTSPLTKSFHEEKSTEVTKKTTQRKVDKSKPKPVISLVLFHLDHWDMKKI